MENILNTVDPNTGMTLMQTLIATLVSLISAALGVVLLLATNAIRKYVPAALATYIDDKYMKQIHSTAMTAIKNILQEGKEPSEELVRILAFFQNNAKDALEHLAKNRTRAQVEKAVLDVALGKVPDVRAELEKLKDVASITFR